MNTLFIKSLVVTLLISNTTFADNPNIKELYLNAESPASFNNFDNIETCYRQMKDGSFQPRALGPLTRKIDGGPIGETAVVRSVAIYGSFGHVRELFSNRHNVGINNNQLFFYGDAENYVNFRHDTYNENPYVFFDANMSYEGYFQSFYGYCTLNEV